MDKARSCSLKSAPVYTEWMATPLPGCAATTIFEPESRTNHRRWMRSMGKQGDSTTSRTSTSHSRASRSPSRHIKNESPCTWLCVVAKHGSWIRRCSEEVSAVPTTPEGPSRSTSPPMGVALSTLVKSANWLCRALQRSHVFSGDWCSFQMDGGPHNAKYNISCHNSEVKGNLRDPWPSRDHSQWQWSQLHKCRIWEFPLKKRGQTHQSLAIPSSFEWPGRAGS